MSELEKFLQLEEQLKPYIKMMTQAADTVVVQEVSKYPIFVVHQQEVNIGIPLLDKDTNKTTWSINASTLEEFVSKQIVFEDKVDEFRKNYKSQEEYLCIFALSELGAQFIYLPNASALWHRW